MHDGFFENEATSTKLKNKTWPDVIPEEVWAKDGTN